MGRLKLPEEVCPLCLGTRHIFNESGTFSHCRCLKDIVLRNELLKTGVDISFFDSKADISSYKPNNKKEEYALEVTHKLIDQVRIGKAYPDKFYCYSGESGCGKSYLVYFIIKQAIKSGTKCKVITLQDLFNSYIHCGTDFDGVKERGLDKYMQYGLLVIDTGREVYNKLLGTVLSMVTSDRMDRGKFTIFTSLFRKPEFISRYSKIDELDGIFTSNGYVDFLDLGIKNSKSVNISTEEIWANKAIDKPAPI